jgi:phosphoadenosine phosphosulfate reductase
MEKILDELNNVYRNLGLDAAYAEIFKLFDGKIAFSTSLGIEDQAITHMLWTSGKKVKIFTLDTGRLFYETLELIFRTENKYKLKIQVFFPENTKVEKMVNQKGINLFYESIENRKECCHIRKTESLIRALYGNKLWISGLRKDQSVTRINIEPFEYDESLNIIKFYPIYNWTDNQVKEYIRDYKIPYNPLHDKGYPSIGCQPCTRAVESGEDIRAGRWWWENPDMKECGLHKKK